MNDKTSRLQNSQVTSDITNLKILSGNNDTTNTKYAEIITYRQVSNIRRTKSQTLNVSCLGLQLFLSNPLKPGIKSRMKMSLEQRRQTML